TCFCVAISSDFVFQSIMTSARVGAGTNIAAKAPATSNLQHKISLIGFMVEPSTVRFLRISRHLSEVWCGKRRPIPSLCSHTFCTQTFVGGNRGIYPRSVSRALAPHI